MGTDVSRRAMLAGAVGIVASTRTALSRTTRRTRLPASFDVDRFVDDVKQANRDGQRAVEQVLARTVSDPGPVLAGLGEPTEAGIAVLHHSDSLTILNVTWAPLMVLLPHNHNMWATIGIFTGREDNILWKRNGSTVEASGASSLSQKEVLALGRTAIHSVVNPIRRLTGAIHIYGGDFFLPGRSEWDAETLVERPHDVGALRKRFAEANERFKAFKP